jgi:hypothetical protein
VASLAGAGRETGIGDALVLDSQVGKHALSGGDLVHGVQVDTAKSLDVDGSAILYTRKSVGQHTITSASTAILSYLIGLVVKLSVVLSDLSLLRVVPDRHGLVKLGILSPFLSVQKPIVAVSPPVANAYSSFHRHQKKREKFLHSF